ncbi:MAG: methyltransferase domain-containing protein [Gemmatimonadales bacterium]
MTASVDRPIDIESPPRAGCCRFCGEPLRHRVVDLGASPLCESYLREEDLNRMEPFYPLLVWVCPRCFLVQLEEYVAGQDIFTEYAYFSSYSDSWLEHSRRYVDGMIGRLSLTADDRVVEVASNDGYLLQYFVERGIPVLGIEPARNVAEVAVAKGVPTRVEFFGREAARTLAAEGVRPALIHGANVLAQVHDLNDFVGGFGLLLAEGGTVTLEFPHLVRMIAENQFDTIYHEHFSYFSLHSTEQILGAHGFQVYDVDVLPTHGGSIRVHAARTADRKPVSEQVLAVRREEARVGVARLEYYGSFEARVQETKRRLLSLLFTAKAAGKRVVGYGAPGKGNTLLNYCGIRTDLIDFTVDRNPYKQGRFLPGTRIPIHHPDRLREARPDYVVLLPWNLKDELLQQLAFIREWGGRFIVPIPEPTILD